MAIRPSSRRPCSANDDAKRWRASGRRQRKEPSLGLGAARLRLRLGSAGRDSSTVVTAEVIQLWQLSAVIMVGIAFGKDSTMQEIGSVLVSDRIISFEPERVGETSNENRGSEPMAGTVLLNRFRNLIGWSFTSPYGQQCRFQIGPIL